MVTQHDTLSEDEYVLRRILNQDNIIDLNLSHPIQRIAFRPTDKDTDGISVFRELFATPEEVAFTGNNPSGYHVIRLPYREILGLGFSIIPNPDISQPNGHSLIPDLHCDLQKSISRALQQSLATLANKNFSDYLVYSP